MMDLTREEAERIAGSICDQMHADYQMCFITNDEGVEVERLDWIDLISKALLELAEKISPPEDPQIDLSYQVGTSRFARAYMVSRRGSERPRLDVIGCLSRETEEDLRKNFERNAQPGDVFIGAIIRPERDPAEPAVEEEGGT